MKNRVIASIVALGALSLSACSSTQKTNPCTLWTADNGPFLVKYTAKTPTDGCVAQQGVDGQYDGIQAEIYPLDNFTRTEVAMVPLATVTDANLDPDTGDRLPGVQLAIGDFTSPQVDANDQCTIPTMTTATNNAGDIKYAFSNVVFSEDASSQGSSFQGDVAITMAGCTTSYTVTALAPIHGCVTDDDCIPTSDAAAGRPFPSGIGPNYHTFCDVSAAGDAASQNLLGNDPGAGGVCFLADPWPSFCPAGTVEGPKGSACPVGK